MANIQEASNRVKQIVNTLGRTFLSIKYPDDFEVYLASFELRDSNEQLLDIFLFPIMPSQIRERETNTVNIKKTYGGVTTVMNPTFNPIDISLSGNFGRGMKILLNNKQYTFPVIGSTLIDKGEKEEFDLSVKTGFGILKKLWNIFKKSKQVDPKTFKPYRLYFFNYSLNTAYLVEIMDFTPDMGLQNNMMWNYSMNMKAILPYEINKQQRLDVAVRDVTNKTVNLFSNQLSKQLNSVLKDGQLFN